MHAPAKMCALTAHTSSCLMRHAAVMPLHSTMFQCLQRCVLTLLGACSNDAFDAETGVDKSKAESVVNLTGNRKAVLAVANGFLLAGGLLLHNVTKLAVSCDTPSHGNQCMTLPMSKAYTAFQGRKGRDFSVRRHRLTGTRHVLTELVKLLQALCQP